MQMLIPGRGYLHGFTRVLNNDEIIALPTTPIDFTVPSGPDRIFVPTMATLISNFSVVYGATGAYRGVSIGWSFSFAAGLSFNSDDVFSALTGQAFTFINAGKDLLNLTDRIVPNTPQAIDNFLNSALGLVFPFGGSNLTGGAADNTLKVSGTYYIFNTITGQFE